MPPAQEASDYVAVATLLLTDAVPSHPSRVRLAIDLVEDLAARGAALPEILANELGPHRALVRWRELKAAAATLLATLADPQHAATTWTAVEGQRLLEAFTVLSGFNTKPLRAKEAPAV